jgi:3-oxoacyl-[acyl-carrier-protein] synthase-3
MRVKIKAIEYYLPSATEDASVFKSNNPDWHIEEIEEKTGICVRHVSEPGQTAVDMGVIAVEKLFASGISKEEVDFIILITQSPDYILPTSACILQDRLGLKKTCVAFDVNLGCSGFIYGIAIAGALIETGVTKKGLVICSETYTKYIDKSDRTCRPLFGDAASAVFLEACSHDTLGPFEMGTDGSGFCDLIVPSSGARISQGTVQNLKLFMDGSKVFMFTMEMVPKCVKALLSKAAKTINDIDLFIFHQASKVVIDNIIRRLDLPKEKVFINFSQIGNTVSASIPIAIKDALDQGRLKERDQVMLVGFGVGYSWGGCLMRWGVNS